VCVVNQWGLALERAYGFALGERPVRNSIRGVWTVVAVCSVLPAVMLSGRLVYAVRAIVCSDESISIPESRVAVARAGVGGCGILFVGIAVPVTTGVVTVSGIGLLFPSFAGVSTRVVVRGYAAVVIVGGVVSWFVVPIAFVEYARTGMFHVAVSAERFVAWTMCRQTWSVFGLSVVHAGTLACMVVFLIDVVSIVCVVFVLPAVYVHVLVTVHLYAETGASIPAGPLMK